MVYIYTAKEWMVCSNFYEGLVLDIARLVVGVNDLLTHLPAIGKEADALVHDFSNSLESLAAFLERD